MESGKPPLFDLSSGNDVPLFTGKDNFRKNCEYCEQYAAPSSDVLIRKFTLSDSRRCAVISVDGMSDKSLIEQDVILAARRFSEMSDENKFDKADGILQLFGAAEVSIEKSLSKGYISALTGDVLVIIEDWPEAFVFGYRSIDSRSVGESPNEGGVRSPHEAFTENIRTNTALLRRRVSDPNMVIEHMKVGRRSNTTVALCYINGLTNPETVASVRDRISAIDIDSLNDSGELEQYLEHQPFDIFPQCGGSELTDAASSALCSGRVVILVNGSPYALFLPVTLASLMSAPEDRYQRWTVSSFIKIIRWAALVISLIGPAFYVAVIAYNPGLLPTELVSISAQNRVNVPFSAVTEVLLMEFALELLREAAVRMPKNVGSALSIVGGIIIGDAAIKAGLISPLLIIIVGITTMCSFTLPSYSLSSSFRLLKYFILALSSILGVLGLALGIILTVTLLAATHGYGAQFSAPFMPLEKRDLLKSLSVLPVRMRTYRPLYCDPLDTVRQDSSEGKNVKR